MTALMTSAVLMVPPLAGAQTPAPPSATQNPSPMVEGTRTGFGFLILLLSELDS